MPLIIVTGYPGSGKSRRAQQVAAYLTKRLADEKKSFKIQVINDDDLHITKDMYSDPREEKKARMAMLSAVERSLNKETIVIADGMNYIKGFRYQLYCVARALSTPHCVLHSGAPAAKVKEWNQARGDQGYQSQVLDELMTRYEEPDGRNRWDAPLFTVIYDDESIPSEAIWDAVIMKKPPPPNMSTVSKPVSDTNYVYELDRITLEIINGVMEAQRDFGTGSGPIVVANATNKVVNPSRNLTLSELRRLRKQFVSINKIRTTLDISRLGDLFVEFLNTNLE
ncbi:chromatin associated protein KTI12 [Hesseltinella vesiculosa]|uniref:Chromatin associated protein KTI12 n=1 Tax=Hesseltinella vesiculosa TaxID=101127 RepID=A0A1X2GM04_9FUNG|nr:chromatin associated protein KTI12 [Hesseltinella vesiculosa]